MANIMDFETAKAWVADDARTQDECVMIAARCAMRALPAVCLADPIDAIALPALRAFLTSAVTSLHPTRELRQAAGAAHAAIGEVNFANPVRNAALNVSDAAAQISTNFPAAVARCAARSGDAASAYTTYKVADSVTYSAVEQDTDWIENADNTGLFHQTLWPDGGMPDFFVSPFQYLQRFWNHDPPTWGFWARWYDGMLRGEPINWGLQRDVALIDDEVWQEGAEAVAKRIKDIEGKHRNTPQPDAIEAERERGGEVLRRHVQSLLKQPSAGEINAIGLAMQIKSAVDGYCNSGPNDLPEEVRHLDSIAKLLAKIGGTLAKVKLDEQQAQKYADELESQVAELQLQIKALEAELIDAKSKQVTGLVKQGFLSTIGNHAAIACTTSTLCAVTYFAAPEFAGEVTKGLGDTITGWFAREQVEFPQIGVDRTD